MVVSCETRMSDFLRQLSALALIATCLLTAGALGQEALVLHGLVREAGTGKPLKGATITTVGQLETEPAHTEDEGKFSLRLKAQVKPSQGIVLRVVLDGYETRTVEQAASSDITISILLKPRLKGSSPSPPLPRAKLPPVIDGLVKRLREGDAVQREGAATGLGNWGFKATGAVPYLNFALTQDPEEKVRVAAATALEKIHISSAPTTTALIIELSDTSDCDVRRTAARVLGAIGSPGDELESALKIAMEDSCVRVRLNAAAAFVEKTSDVTKVDNGVIKVLTDAIQEPEVRGDPTQFENAAHALTKLGPRANTAAPILISIQGDSRDSKLASLAMEPLVALGASARGDWKKRLHEVPLAQLPEVVKSWLQADPSVINTEESAIAVFYAMNPECTKTTGISIIEPAKKLADLMPWAKALVSTCLVEVYLRTLPHPSDISLIFLRTQRHILKSMAKNDLAGPQFGDNDLPRQLDKLEDAIASMGPSAAPAINAAIERLPDFGPELYPLLLRTDPSLKDVVVRTIIGGLSNEATIEAALKNLQAIEETGGAAGPEVTRLLCSDHSKSAAHTLEAIKAVDVQTLSHEFRTNPQCAETTADISYAMTHSPQNIAPAVAELAKAFADGDKNVQDTAKTLLLSLDEKVSPAVPVFVESLQECFNRDLEPHIIEKERRVINILPKIINKLPFAETKDARNQLDMCASSLNDKINGVAQAAITRLTKKQ